MGSAHICSLDDMIEHLPVTIARDMTNEDVWVKVVRTLSFFPEQASKTSAKFRPTRLRHYLQLNTKTQDSITR